MTLKNLMSGTALALVTFFAQAHEFKAGAITISHPYARATAAGQPSGGGFMTFVNGGGNDKLLSVSAEVSKAVELHEMKMEGDVMKMRQVEGIDLQAGKTVELKPGGQHVMFIGLTQTLKSGAHFPLTLRFEKAGEVKVEVTVMTQPMPAEPVPAKP